MNIVISGCSHSTWLPTQDSTRDKLILDDRNKLYGNVLATMLSGKLTNLSDSAKDNRQIIIDAIKTITKNPDTTDILIIQLTEFERINFFKTESFEYYNPNDKLDYLKNWIKFNPACDSHNERPKIKFDAAIDGYQDIHIGHPTGLMEQTAVLADIVSLQSLCEQYSIDLYILNWHGFTNLNNTPIQLVDNITWDNFLIENPDHHWYHHLLWCDYKLSADSSHFCRDAHEYIAQRLYKLIKEGERTTIESEPYRITKPIYDYTN